jgi:hypothetical protein
MDLNHDNDWYRYFGDSTVYISSKSGLSVHLPDSGKPNEADREPDGSAREDSGGLGQNHAGHSD